VKYTVLTLFPKLVSPWAETGILAKAAAAGQLEFDIRDLRDWSTDRHRTADDAPYGGGAGMVIRVDLVARALAEVRTASPHAHVVLLTPAGERLDQTLVERLARESHLVLLSGRYEGFDARVEELVDREVSVGDYVLMGGEAAAVAVIEATARLQDGVLHDSESALKESFATGLLDYPEYTRPPEFEGRKVPEILLAGNHGEVARWRRRQALERTFRRRPDLLEKADLTADDEEFLESLRPDPTGDV
jgi:tRNA (guanine37-N1)-methyltransferase